MGSLKTVLTDLETRVKSTIGKSSTNPVIKEVGQFNNQFANEDAGMGQTYNPPSVFFEFVDDIEYSGKGNGVDKARLIIRAYIAKITNKTYDYTIYDLKDIVHIVLQGFSPTDCSSMQRVAERRDKDHSGRLVYEIDYLTEFTDTVKNENDGTGTIEGLQLSLDLKMKIDNYNLNIGICE